MKKTIVVTLMICFTILSLGLTAYSIEGHTDAIKFNVYINDMEAPIDTVGDNNYLRVNYLKEFGFDIIHNKEKKEMKIYQNPNLIMKSVEIDDYKTDILVVGDTEYKVYINDCTVEAKEINGDIVIDINSFINVNGFDFEKRMDNKDNSCDIYITNSDGFINTFTLEQKTKIHISKKGNYLYSGNNKVGLIQDNMEWISLDYIKRLIKFDEISEEKNKDEMWICLEKGDYDVEIQVEDKRDAFAEQGRFYMDLTAIPFELDGELYLSLVDSIQLFNLEIIRDSYPNKNEIKNTTGYGNYINGINIIKNDEWIYYVNNNDNDTLYRTKKDMSENKRIISTSIKQFYIHNNEIFYTGYGFDGIEKGLHKAGLDGSKQQQIISEDVSFFNILGDEIYYCDESYGGNLCKIDINGKNKETVIEGKIIYPNINGGWVYYINTQDNDSIYRYKLDGGYNVKINNVPSKSLNVDGKKVYFSDSYDSYFMNHDGSFKNKLFGRSAKNILISENNIFWISDYGIYKQNKNNVLTDLIYDDSEVKGIGLQGDELNILQEKLIMSINRYDISNEKSEMLDIPDGYKIEKILYPYIYYKKYGSGIMKYNIDTKESVVIVSDYVSKVCNIIDDWVYYCTWGDGLYRVKVDGTNKMKLLDKNIYDVNVDNSGIYFLISQSGMTIEDYCKVNLDGTNKQVLINDLKEDYPFSSQIYKDYIYYLRKDGLYRIKKNGTEKKKVIDKPVYEFKIADDHIYYNYDDDLYSITCDGKEDKKLITDIGIIYTKYEDNVFYLSEKDEVNFELYRHNLTNKQTEEVPNMQLSINSSIDFADTKDNYLVINFSVEEDFGSESMSSYLIDMKANKVSTLLDKIKDCYVNSLVIDKGYIYYTKEEMKSKLIIGDNVAD